MEYKNSKVYKLAQKVLHNEKYQKLHWEVVDFPEYEGLNGSMIMPDIWDRLMERNNGEMPSQKEFVQECLVDSKEFFFKKMNSNGERWLMPYFDGQKQWYAFCWNERLIRAIIARAARSYPSFVAEYTAKLMIEYTYPKFKIIENNYLDRMLGSDITIVTPDNKVIYLHVMRDSYYSRHYFINKSGTTGKLWHNGVCNEFDRDFNEAHAQLFYDTNNNKYNLIINDCVFITQAYIKEVIDNVIDSAEPLADSQLLRLDQWLIDTGIDKNGVGLDCFVTN
ncbi:hypothetical protein IRY55_02510 [Savagea sp. SN6]|uniref:Uncharacterized protein n=1 Tax=Savagea serpentis TaxID=2785297 RepID=A0A8J7G6U0_9BACL|nr:hypothetical protein [Savagea serpentis]MBF4500223.1 hypothetical protein [Savagea serpentis]